MASINPPIVDSRLAAVAVLLGPESAGFLEAALGTTGARLRSSKVSQIRYVPERSVTVQYSADVIASDGRPARTTLVATSGVSVPEGVPVFADDDLEIAFWEFPRDPFLPGLASAADPDRVGHMLEQLGVRADGVELRTRAYRAGRRAVIEATASTGSVFLKVVRPGSTAALQTAHATLARHLPIPHTLGWSEDLGIVSLQAMGGRTLRAAVTSQSTALPDGGSLVGLLDRFPADPGVSDPVPGPHERAEEHASLLRAVVPGLAGRIDTIVERVEAAEPEAMVPVHGDFHSSQVLIDGGAVVGLVDVDTAGTGERSNDLAGMLGHLSTLAIGSPARAALERYGSALIADFDRRVDPAALRLRTAAVVLGLATGPFRVQLRQWAADTERRIALAERWVESADAIR